MLSWMIVEFFSDGDLSKETKEKGENYEDSSYKYNSEGGRPCSFTTWPSVCSNFSQEGRDLKESNLQKDEDYVKFRLSVGQLVVSFG